MPTPAPQKLPARVQLPSGLRVSLRVRVPEAPLARERGAPFFSELFDAEARGALALLCEGKALALESLPLRDFHAVRALALAGALVREPPVELPCKNCRATLVAMPCRALPLGPFRDAELDDPELDEITPTGEPQEIADVALTGGRVATTVTLAPRTAREARPLFAALAAPELVVDAAFVSAMGIVALGPETEPARLARALEAADDEAFASVLDVFLATHYPLRLGAPLRCEECGARNDVDAPYEREFAPSDPPLGAHPAEDTPASYPTDDELSALAEAHFRELARRFPEDSVDLVLTDETPAVDDGGEPLMGSYVPGSVGDAHGVPERPTVTLYLRTFRAMWDDDGPYDVAGEVRETVEHELTHHEHWLTGDDPMDDEERALIAEEARRLHGKKQLARGAARGLGADVLEFLRRTWLIWALILLAVAVTLAAGPGLGAVE